MAKNRIYVVQPNEGLDTSIATAIIDEKSASDLLNIRWNEGGTIEKRYGFQPWAETISPSKALGVFKTKIVSINGTKLYGSEWESSTMTEISGQVFNANAEYYSFSMIKSLLFVWNGIDPGTVYDGSTLTRPGTIPNASFSIYYKGYHLAAGTASQPSRLYISTIANSADFTNAPEALTEGPDPDNPTDVPGATVFTGTLPDIAQFIDVAPSDNEEITMLKEYQDYVIIAKRSSIWSLTLDLETNRPVIQLISKAVGCVNNNTAVSVGNDLYFLSEYGVTSLGNEKNYIGTLRTNVLSGKIQRIIDSITQSAWKRANAAYHDNYYMLGIPTDSNNTIDTVIAFDIRFGGWTVWSTMNPRSMVSHIDGSGNRRLLFAQEGASDICYTVPGFYYDRLAGINAYWTSKSLDAGILDVTKRWTFLTLFMRNIGSTVSCAINTEIENIEAANVFEGGYPTGLGFNLWGRNTTLGRTLAISNSNEGSISSFDDAWRTPLNVEARTLSFTISNNTPGENFVFAGFAAEFISLKAYYFDQSHTF